MMPRFPPAGPDDRCSPPSAVLSRRYDILLRMPFDLWVRQLGLRAPAGVWVRLRAPAVAQADNGGATADKAIEQLLQPRIVLRNNRRLQTAMRASRLPAVKTLAAFDVACWPGIEREQVESPHELGFVARA